MLTSGDIFAGGGGWSLGARASGFTPVWAIENDPAIAEVYAANVGAHVIVKPAQDVDPRKLAPVDLLCASPPCQAHSNARSKKLAAREDAEVGMCVLDYVRTLRPRFVFIENVEGWKRSATFKAMFHGLHALGYFCNVQVLNAADVGVPQTRRRLILRASREGFLPALPAPVKWRGWYEAIEDLIPTLPESRFADWQLARLPKGLCGDFLATVQGANSDYKQASEQAPTLAVAHGAAKYRAFLVNNQTSSNGKGISAVSAEMPAQTVTASIHSKSKMPHAFIVDGKANQITAPDGGSVTLRQGDAPIFSIVAQHGERQPVRAFIVGGGNTNLDKCESKAREASEPTFTIAADSALRNTRAWLEQGRVVAMTPRALARFQSFPDSFTLPDKAGLACRIIGNAVPPLLAQILSGELA